MNYQAAYNYLLSLNNVSGRAYLKDPKHCQIYLTRLQKLLDILGNPEKQIPHYIHVTGTSGKGSVCLTLDSILRTDHRRVGTLTSPSHDGLLGRTEVAGQAITKSEFTKLVEKIKSALEIFVQTSTLEIPSSFEILTALSLMYFADKKVDWAIIEVGMGGRYDSTNIIPHKDVAIITNIGLDHTDVLGNTKAKIAYEKAGIIKSGCTVFTGETDKNILKIIATECHLQKTPLHQIVENSKLNSAICIAVSRYLGVDETAIEKGIRQTHLPIRFEIINKNPLIILDGAHNDDKMKTTVASTQTINRHNHLLVGFAANKNIDTMIKQLAKLKPQTIACTRFTQNFLRPTADPRTLKSKFQKLLPKTKIQVFLDPTLALAWSKTQQKTSDLLLITGSMYLAGELRQSFKK